MKVYIELNKLSDREIINIMQMFVFAWKGDTETKRNEWQALLNAFEQVRTSSAETDRIFNGIEYHEQCAFSFLVVRIVKDWDRLSFSHLYTRSCQRWNRENKLIMNDCVAELRDLGSNEKTIDYACKVDLENIDSLYTAGDIEGLRQLLYYSEDCDDAEQQCSYKVKAENKIKRCINRLQQANKLNLANSTNNNKLTDAFKQQDAIKVLSEAINAGYLNDDYAWTGKTCGERAYFAYMFCSEILRSGNDYDKLFTSFWGCRSLTSDLSKFREKSKEKKYKEYERKLAIDALFA